MSPGNDPGDESARAVMSAAEVFNRAVSHACFNGLRNERTSEWEWPQPYLEVSVFRRI